MRTRIIDELRPTDPEIDPVWEAETMRRILEDRGHASTPTRPAWQGRTGRLALVAATIAVIVGGLFVARQYLPAEDIRPAGPVPAEKIQTIDPSAATVLKLGDTLDVVADLPQTFGDDPVSFSGFTDDGQLVGVVRPQPADPASVELEQSFPVLYDLDAKAFTILDDRTRPETTQVINVSGDDSTVVWAEVVGMNIDHSSFTIYAYDRESKKLTTLGGFNDPDGQIVYGNDLVLAGDTAYFSTPTYPGKAGQEAVYSVPVDGSSQPNVLAAGAAMVQRSGDTLTYQVKDPNDQDAYPTFFSYDVATRSTTPVPVSDHAADPGFCGAEFTDDWETWCANRVVNGSRSSESNLLTIKEQSGRTTEFTRFPADNPPRDVKKLGPWTSITVTMEGGQDRTFLVDLDTKEMKVFPDNTSSTALSPDRSSVLISSFADKGPGLQRIVRIPDAD